jgi:hypothetical protein
VHALTPRSYGYSQTSNSYFVARDPRTIAAVFARLRAFPGGAPALAAGDAAYPASLAGLPVTRVRDLTRGHGYDSSTSAHAPALPLSGGPMLTLYAAAPAGAPALTLTARASGTEPKARATCVCR